MQNIQKINRGETLENISISIQDDNDTLKSTIICMMGFMYFEGLMNVYPDFFKELFKNTDINDNDFLIIYQFYNKIEEALIDLNMTMFMIDYKAKTTVSLPTPPLFQQEVKKYVFNGVNTHIKRLISIMNGVIYKLNYKKEYNSENIDTNIKANGIADLFLTITDLKKCSYEAYNSKSNLFADVAPNHKKEIFPFLHYIRMYLQMFFKSLQKHLVPALNEKLKDGQKIPIREVPNEIPQNPNSPSVTADAPIGAGVPSTNALVQGVGATYA